MYNPSTGQSKRIRNDGGIRMSYTTPAGQELFQQTIEKRRVNDQMLRDRGRSLQREASYLKERHRNKRSELIALATASLEQNNIHVVFAATPSEACRWIAAQLHDESLYIGGMVNGLGEVTPFTLQQEGINITTEPERWLLSGTVAISAREGAIVLPSTTPFPATCRHVIFIAGPEKITADLDEALVMLESWSLFGSAEPLPGQTLVLHGPSRSTAPSGPTANIGDPESNGPLYDTSDSLPGNIRSITVIFLDNGRNALLSTRVASTLDCVDCGACQTFCPVHLELGDAFGGKLHSGRGTALTGLLDEQPLDAVGGSWNDCLQCEACLPYCPTGIDIAHLNRLRGSTAESDEIGPLRQAWIELTADRKRMSRRLANPFRRSRRSASRRGVTRWRRWLPNEEGRLFPPSTRPLHRRIPEFSAPIGPIRLKVAYFSDCLGHFGYPHVALNALRLMTHRGAEIYFPKTHGCCGAPAYYAGQLQKAATAILQLLPRLHDPVPGQPYERLVTTSPLCAQVLSRAPQIIREAGIAVTPELLTEAERFAARVTDAAIVLVEDLDAPAWLEQQERRREASVSLLPSCHQNKKATAAQTELLHALPGLTVQPPLDKLGCCGFGGFHAFDRYETGLAIGQRALHASVGQGADSCVVSCTGCLLHLLDAQAKSGQRIARKHQADPVMHLYELIGFSLRRDE